MQPYFYLTFYFYMLLIKSNHGNHGNQTMVTIWTNFQVIIKFLNLDLPHKQVCGVEVEVERTTLSYTVGYKIIEHHVSQVESLSQGPPTHTEDWVTVLAVHKVAFYHCLKRGQRVVTESLIRVMTDDGFHETNKQKNLELAKEACIQLRGGYCPYLSRYCKHFEVVKGCCNGCKVKKGELGE